LLVALLLLPAALPPRAWPWSWLLPLVAYGFVVLLIPPLRRTAPRLAAGRTDQGRLPVALALGVLTSGVLLAYQALVHPDVTALAGAIPVAAFGSLLLAGVCFSVGNAVLEELIFRGVLYEAVVAEWGAAVAVAVTAAFFGLVHLQGYPPGALNDRARSCS
jgi:membrane protease YdiL (CAAX protease family)